MFKTGKKSKIILRIISIILIQAFLFMDVAWCGGTQLLNDITPHKTSTLAPKIYINAQNFQQTFNNFSRQIFANIPVVKQIQYFSNPNPEPNNTLLSKIDLTTNTALKINTAKNRLQGLSKVVKKIDSNLNRVLNYSSFILKSLAATAKFFISMFLRFFKLGFNIPYELGNIASGNWTESQHYDLNQIIKNLIDDADHNLSDNYDHKQLKDDIRNIVNTFDKLPPKLKDELTYRLQATNPEYTLDSLVKDFNSLLDNPNLNLFFLKPKFNEDKFSFLYKDEHGTEIPLHARAHFGHNQTKGKDKEQNCYIAAPFFDSCTNGEKLALIVHELTHLLLGKGDQVHSIAEQIQFAFIRQYDTKADIPKIQKGLVEYIELKEKITHAVSQDDREKAESLYKRWIEVTENLDISDVSVHSISSLIFMSLQKQIAPVLGQIITNLKLAGGDANQRGIIIGSILEDVGITGPLARLIFDIINSMPFSVDSIEYDLENSLLAVSSRLATEIKRVANPEFSQDMNSLIEEVVDEVVGALYEDKVEKEYWRKKILNDVVPNRIDMHIPEHLFRKDLFSENKDLLLATLYTFNHSVCGYGAYSGNFKKLYLSSEINFSEIRSTFKHELIHYLADYKQIKIDINWEFTTYAIDLTDKIMYSKAGDIETAERDMALYIHEYGSGLKELYNRGKELGENDEATYILKPHEVEDTAGYFSIDLLVIEAIKVYQAKGIPTKELRRYLTYKTKANRTIFEEQQFYRDQYAAQRVAGIIMAGIFMAEYEKSGIHPVTSLRNYFHELDQIFGKPSEADQLWIDNTLIPELETLAQQLYGKKTRLEKADVTDKLGLWIFDEVSKWQATIKYWPFTLYPRQRQDKDRKLHQQLARERSIGNLLLSIYRFRYGKDEKLQKQQAELFDNPAFSCLWDTLLIPRAVFQGVPTVQKKINRIVADGEIKQGLQVPELIQKVFHDKYNLGNAQAEQDLFSAYPLHIQYIDSVLYQWSQHKQDPRVKPGSEVSIAVTKTFNAWSKIMFNADQFRNYEDIFELIMQEIWPEYKKLFEQDVEDEKNRNLIEQMEKEELVEPGLMDPDGLSAQQQKMLEDFFNALPQDIQDQIIGQAMQMMNAVSACSGQGSASDMPDAAGQSGKFSSGQMPSQAQPQASASSIEQSIEAVESLIGQVEKMLEGITKQADNIGDEAQSISDQIPTSPGKLSEHGKDKAEQISNMAHELQNSTATLGQLTDQMQQGTGDIKDKSFDLQDSAPPVESATSTAQAATDLDDNTQKLQDKIKQLQDKVNELVKTADRLKDFMQTSDDPSQIDQVGKAVQKDSDEVGKSSQEISSSTQTIQNSLQSLQDQIKSLTQQIKEYEQGISEYKETAKAQQEVDDTQTPSETSVPQDQAGTQAQTGDAQSAQDSIPTTSQQAGDQARKESNQMPSDQPMAEVSSLPDGPTALKQILDNAKQLTDSDEMVDRHEDEEFTTVVDEAWLEALKKKELLAEMQRTGLNKAELKEYKEWRELLSENLIDNMTDLFRGFIVPQLDVEKIRKKYSGILKKPIKGILGGLPFIKRQEATPLPVKITLLIDVSSSMRGNRILWAKLTMMLLLEVIFAIKDELESLGYPDNLVIIEFELGSFNHGTSLFISHDTSSEIGEDRKERLIYDAIKKLEATGCTDEKKALGEFTTRLIESEDPAGFEDKARRILIAIGDGDVDSIAKDDIRQVIEYALENEIEIFGVSVGDDSSRQSVLDAFSRERAVLPQEQDLSDLPLLVMQKFAECLKPPGADIPWETIINSVFGIFGFGSIFNSYLKPLLNFFNKETEQDKNTAKEEPLRNTEYRHFFYQTIDGKDYLVWRKKDKKGDIQQLKWQRGAGGLYTPELVTVDDDDNEQKILDILQSVYLQEAEYASYSQDGKLYLRYGSKGEVLLMEKDREGSWQKKKEFLPKTQSTNFKEQGSYRIYDQGDLRWRIDSLENIDIELGKDVWFSVVGASKFSQNLYIEYDEATGMYVIFDSVNSRVVIAKKNDKYLDTIYDLAIGNLKPQLEPEGKLIRLIGSQGLGKDVLIRAAAHLANEEVYFVAGNNDMEPEDFREYQTIGLEEEAGTGHLYTATNHVQHNGGWVVYDEWNKIKPKVRSTLKTQIAAKTHQRWVEENAKEKLSTFKNHERARFFATANYDEEGIVSSGISDQALQERYANIRFVWRDPASEKGLQYKLALDEIKKLRPELANNELNEEKQRIREIIDMLVDISWPMRLSYAGYDSTQQQELVKDDFKNWTRLLTDDAFMPATKPGKNLRRAPSPRVLANIIRHAVMYPKTWQHTAWSVVELWFNFYADGMKPQDRARQFKAIKQQFEFPVHTAGSNGIKNEDDLPPLILKESYFKVEDEYLIVTPEKIDGQNSEYWDKIKIWIHPEAREYIKQYGLPEDMRYWLSIGNVSNSWLLYWSLQARSLGKSVILVGEQGTGKSFLSQAIAQLISGPEIEMIEITPDTDKEALTFQAYIRKGKSGYDFGPVARSIAKKKTCVLEESTQGSPGVMGTLNEAIERHFMNMPNGHKLGEEGDGRFGVIHAVNTPGSSAFHVKAFSAEFIERHAVLHVPQLPLQDMKDFIISLATYNNTLVNPRVIGERRLDVASGEIQKLANTDEDKWDGLLGAIQWIRYQKSQNPQDKNLLPRVPGMRTLKNMIKELKSYWQTKAAFYDGDMQQLFLDFFNKHFVLEGSLKQKAAWAHEIKDAFTQARLWSDKEDGLEKYLAGEDMIVQKLPLLRKPDTGEYQLDKILVYLQENTQGVGVAVHIEQLRKLVTDIALASKDWEVLSFSQRLKHMYKLKDIYQILGLIFEHRQGRGYTAHTDENITMMKDIQEGIVQAHALRENWPPSFFEQEGNYEDLEKAWQGEQEEVLSVGSLEIDDILGKIAVNFEDTEYKKEQIVKLKKIIEEKIPGLKNKYLHEIVLQLSLLMAMRGDVYDILKHQAQKEPVKELAGYVDDVINSSSFPLEAQKAVVFPAEYLECFEKAGMKNITPHEAAKRIEEILAAEEKHAKIMEVFKQYPALFQKLYSWMVLMATVPGLVANEREEFVNSAKIIYALWQRITKSFEQAPDVKDKDRDTEMPAVEKRVLFKNMAMENEKKLEVKSSDGRKMFLLHVKQGDKPNIYYIDKDGRGRFLFDEPPDEIVGKTLTKEGYGYIETKTGGKFGIYYVRPDKDKAIEIVTGAKGEFSDWELKDNGYGLVPATLADGYSIYYVQPGKDNALEVVKGAESILASYIAESGYGFIEAKLADGWSFYYLQTGEEPIEVVKGAKTILGRKTTERGYGYTNAELVDGWSVYYVQPGEEPIEVIKGAKSISHNDITESGYGYIKAELADGYSLYYLQPGKEPIEVVKGVENTFDQVITESGCGFIEAKLADSWSFYYLQPGEEPIEVGKGAKNVPDWKITERGYGYIKAKLADGWSFYYLQPGEELIEVVKGAKSIPHNDITESGYGYIMADLSDGWSVYCLQPGKDKALKAVKGAKKEPAVKITKSGYGYIAAELADSWSVYYLQPGKDKVLKVVKGAKSILGRNITENGYGYIKAELTDGLSFYYLQPGEEPIEVVKGAKDIPVWKMAESGYGCIEAEFDEGYSVYYLQPGKDNALEVVKGEENIYDCKITESGYGYIETEFDEGYSIYYLQPGKDQALEVVTGAKEISGREITERGYGYIKAELADGWGVYYVQPGKDQALEVVRGAKRIPDLEITNSGYGYIAAELADGLSVYYLQPGKDTALEVLKGAEGIHDSDIKEAGYVYVVARFIDGYHLYCIQPGKNPADDAKVKKVVEKANEILWMGFDAKQEHLIVYYRAGDGYYSLKLNTKTQAQDKLSVIEKQIEQIESEVAQLITGLKKSKEGGLNKDRLAKYIETLIAECYRTNGDHDAFSGQRVEIIQELASLTELDLEGVIIEVTDLSTVDHIQLLLKDKTDDSIEHDADVREAVEIGLLLFMAQNKREFLINTLKPKAEECMNTGDDEDSWQKRIAIIKAIANLRDITDLILEGQTLDYVIEEFLRYKTNPSLEVKAEVRAAAEAGLIKFIDRNSRQNLADVIKEQVKKCEKTKGQGDKFFQQRIAIIEALSELEDLEAIGLDDLGAVNYIKIFLFRKRENKFEEDPQVRAAAEAGAIKFVNKNNRKLLADVIKEQIQKCRRSKADDPRTTFQRIKIIEALSELKDLEDIEIDGKPAAEQILQLLEYKTNLANENSDAVRAVAEDSFALFVANNSIKGMKTDVVLASIIKHEILILQAQRSSYPDDFYIRVINETVNSLLKLTDLEKVTIDNGTGWDYILDFLKGIANDNKEKANVRNAAVECLSLLSFIKKKKELGVQVWVAAVKLTQQISEKMQQLDELIAKLPPERQIKRLEEEIEQIKLQIKAKTKTIWDEEKLSKYIKTYAEKCWYSCGEKDTSWSKRAAIIEVFARLKHIGDIKIDGRSDLLNHKENITVDGVSAVDYIAELLRDKTKYDHEQDKDIRAMAQEALILFFDNNCREKLGVVIRETVDRYKKTVLLDSADPYISQRQAAIRTLSRLKDLEDIMVDGKPAREVINEFLESKYKDEDDADAELHIVAGVGMDLLAAQSKPETLLANFIKTYAEECRRTFGNKDEFWFYRKERILALSILKDLENIKIDGEPAVDYIEKLLRDKTERDNELDPHVCAAAEGGLIKFIANNKREELSKLIKEKGKRCRSTKKAGVSGFAPERSAILRVFNQLLDDLEGVDNIDGVPARDYIIKLFKYKASKKNEKSGDVRSIAKISLFADTINKGIAKLRKPSLPQDAAELQRKVAEKQKQIKELKARLPARKKSVKRSQAEKIFREFLNQARLPALVRENNYINETSIEDKLRQTGVFLKPGALKLTEAQKDNFIKACPDELANKEFSDIVTDKTMYYLMQDLYDFKNGVSSGKRSFETAYDTMYYKSAGEKRIRHCLNIINAAIQTDKIGELFELDVEDDQGNALNKNILNVIDEAKTGLREPEIHIAIIAVLKNLSKAIKAKNAAKYADKIEAIEQMVAAAVMAVLETIISETYKKDVEKKVKIIVDLLDAGAGEYLSHSPFQNIYSSSTPGIKSIRDEPPDKRVLYYADIARALARNGLKENKFMFDDTEHIIRLAGKDLLPIESCFDNDEIKDWRNTGWVGNGLVVINFLDALAQTGYAEIDITHYLKYAYEMLESMDGLKAHYSMMEQMLKFFTTLVNLKDEGMSKKLSQTIKIQVDEFIKNVKLSDNASIRIEQRKNQQELEKRFELSLKVIRFLSQPAVQKLIPEANNQIKQLIPVVDDLRGEFALADVLVATKKFIYTLIDAGFADEILVERMFFGLEEVSFIQFLYKYAQCYPLKCGMNQVNPAYTAVLHEGYRHLMEGLYSIVFAWQPEETGKSAVPPGDIEKVIPKLTDKRIAELISMLTPLQVQQLLDKAAPLMPPQGLEPQKATPDIRVAITRQTPFIRKLHSEGLFYGGATGIIEGEYIDKIFEYAKGLEAFALSKEEKALYLLNEYFYKLKYKNEDDQSLLNEAIKVINLLDKKEKINVYLNIVNLFVQIGQPEKVLDINTGISNKDGVIELINSLIPPGTTADIRKRFVLPLNALIKALQAKGMTDKAEELKKVFDSQIQALNLVSVHMNTWMKIYQELGIIEKIPKDEVKKLFELILNSGTAEEKFELKIQLFETMAEVGLIDEIKTWLTKDLASGKTNILEMIEEDIKTQSQQSVDIVKDASLYSRFLAAVSKTEYWTPTQISNLQNQIFTYIKRIDKMRLHAQPIIEFIKFLIASGQADEIINLKNDNGANLIEMAEEGSLESVYELIDVLSQPQAVSKLLTQETIDEYIDLLIKIVLSSAEGYSNNNEEVKGIKTLIRLVKTLARAGLSDKLLTVKDGVGNKDIFELIFEKDPQIQGRVLGEIVQLLYSVTYCGTIKKHAMPKVQEMTPFKKEFISQLRDKGLFFGSARHELSMEELLALLAPLGEDEFTDKMFVHGIIKQYLKRYLLAAKYGINADGKDTFLRKAFWRERTNGQGTLMSLLNIINALIQAGELEKIFTLKSEPEITDTDNPFIFPYLEVVAAGERKWPFDVKMDIVLTVNALVEALKGRKDIFDKIELEEEDILNRLNNIVMSNIIAARAEAVESRSVPKQIEFIRVLAHAGRSKEMDTMAFSLKEMLSKIMPLGMIERTGFLADFIEALVVAGMTDKLAKLKYKPVSPGAGTDEVNIVEWVFGNIMETALNPDNFKQMAKDHAEYAKNASRFLGVVKQTGLLKDEDIKTLIHQIRGTIDNNISIEYVAEPMSEFIYALLNVQRQGKDVSATINEMLDKFLKISSPKNAGKYLPMDLVKACCKLISVLSQLEVTDKIIADVNSKIQQLLSEVIRNLNDDATAIGRIKGLQQDDVIMVVNTLIDSGLFDELRRTWLSLLFDETKKYADYSHSILNDAWDKLMSVIYNLAYYAGPKQNVASSIVKSIDRKGGVEEYLSSITDGKLPPADNIYERSHEVKKFKYSPKGTYRAELSRDTRAILLYNNKTDKILAMTNAESDIPIFDFILTNDERFLIAVITVELGQAQLVLFDLEQLKTKKDGDGPIIHLTPYVKSINYTVSKTTSPQDLTRICYIEITQDDQHLIVGFEQTQLDKKKQVNVKCGVVPHVFELKDAKGDYKNKDELASNVFGQHLSIRTKPTAGIVEGSKLSPDDRFLVLRDKKRRDALEIYSLKGEDGTLPIDKGLENFPTKFEFDHDILDFTFTNDSRFLIVAAIIGTEEKLIFYDLSTIVSGPFLPQYAEVPLPSETGLISRIKATPKDNFVAISTMRRAVHFVKIKHKDGRYKTEKELQESLEEKFDITIDELTHSVDDLDFSKDDTTFGFFEGGDLHSYHFPIEEVEIKPKETPQSAKLLKALLYLRQVLLSKETVSTETIEIPDDVVEALWVLSTIKQPQQYMEESLDILSAHYELMKLLIKQSWFEELVKYIEAFQDNLDFGGAGLMSYIAQRDVDKKPVSYINVQKQIEKLRTNIDKLHKEMADKIEELALENINWAQGEAILDYFFRYYSSRLSLGSRSTTVVFGALIKGCDFGEKFAKRYGLELPNDYQDKRLIEFTYKLYAKFWVSKLFPELDREAAGFVVFDGYEGQLGEAIEGSITTDIDYNFMLSLLTDKEREASEIKGNYRPKDKKTALDLKRAILGELKKTSCRTLYTTNKPDMTKMRGLVNKYSKDKAKILSKPPKEIITIKTRIAILEEQLKSLSAEQQPKKDKESDAKGQLEQKLSKLVRERERLAKDIAVVSLESIKKLIESMKLEQDDVVRNVMKVYLRAFDSYGRCLITYSYPQHNFRQYEFYIPPEVSAIKALRQLLGDDVSNHFKDEDKQKIKDILEELKRQKAEHKKIQKQIEILKTELARIDALRSVDIDVTAGKADELERQLVTNILVEQAI